MDVSVFPAKLFVAMLLGLFLLLRCFSANAALFPSGDEMGSGTFSGCQESSRKMNPSNKADSECGSRVIPGKRVASPRSLRSKWPPGPPSPSRNQPKILGYGSPPPGTRRN
ncbi:PREDICTED: uncharacterized protein LOC104591468 [Nelumbo nucifera]|uniref:Uncharacterized protein LOC104591468 n=2 Tax=Nelumbo nucifera TaxID=4432 RepID=A0A1U7ZBQ8_NELNU|nr:PREDICTED: uncharacterized protein LOC104591468 [Nelumbo nucifera]DAD30837.1 TPA_asm: hypothetical protein HUJ06_009688 [Nelumbo nucifera]